MPLEIQLNATRRSESQYLLLASLLPSLLHPTDHLFLQSHAPFASYIFTPSNFQLPTRTGSFLFLSSILSSYHPISPSFLSLSFHTQLTPPTTGERIAHRSFIHRLSIIRRWIIRVGYFLLFEIEIWDDYTAGRHAIGSWNFTVTNALLPVL